MVDKITYFVYDDDDLQRIYNERYFATRSRPKMWNRRAEFIIETFHPKTFLDIGCAFGELVYAMDSFGIESYGIDGSDHAISRADNSIQHKIFKVNLNSDTYPFDDEKFDIIGSFYSVEHIHDIDFFCEELKRILAKNGKVWFLTPDIGLEGRNEKDVFTNTYNDWKKIFEKHQFKVTKFNPYEMMALKGKLGVFKFYKLPKSIQKIIKFVAYSYSNRKMEDTSFIIEKTG